MRGRVEKAAAANPGGLVTWEMIYPDEENLPEEIRGRHANAILGEFSGTSDRYELVRTLVVNPDATPERDVLPEGDVKVRDRLLEIAVEHESNIVTADDIDGDPFIEHDSTSVINRMKSYFKPQLQKGISCVRVVSCRG